MTRHATSARGYRFPGLEQVGASPRAEYRPWHSSDQERCRVSGAGHFNLPSVRMKIGRSQSSISATNRLLLSRLVLTRIAGCPLTLKRRPCLPHRPANSCRSAFDFGAESPICEFMLFHRSPGLLPRGRRLFFMPESESGLRLTREGVSHQRFSIHEGPGYGHRIPQRDARWSVFWVHNRGEACVSRGPVFPERCIAAGHALHLPAFRASA